MAMHRGEYRGQDLRGMRRKLKLTQAEVARVWGKHQSNLCNIELNRRRISHNAYKGIRDAILKAAELREEGRHE